ncbi:MAG TPA: hypothetical protein V6C57_16755 [Coleofasciculaceae cyanobacterium]
MEHNLGSTGSFPDGKLNEYDEGQLRIGIAPDPTAGLVVVNFGTPVASFAMPPDMAVQFAYNLIKCAQQIQPDTIEITLGGNEQ